MRHIASAYGRALLPRGLETKDDTAGALRHGDLDLALGGGVYRAVVAVERLLDRLQAALQGLGKTTPVGSRGRPVGCG